MRKPSEAADLAAALRRTVGGEVRFDAGSRAAYATDGSNYRQVPVGVVIPRDEADVAATLAACRERGVPVLARGAGTSLAGQGCNAAVVLDFSKYLNKVLELDPERRAARVQPGVVLDQLREAAGRHGLTFGPDPATHAWCTLGGMIGNNACGVHGLLAGRTADNTERLRVLTYDGTELDAGPLSEAELAAAARAGGRRGALYAALRDLRDRHAAAIRQRYPRIPRRVSGYNLDELLPERGFHLARALVGTESTCAVTLEATVRLVPSPPHRRLVVLGYPDAFTACDHVPALLALAPIGLELIDETLVRHAAARGAHERARALLPEGRGWLLVEVGGESPAAAEAAAGRLARHARQHAGGPSVRRFRDRTGERELWHLRESALGLTARPPGRPPHWEGWEDSAVHPARLGAYLRDLVGLWKEFGYSGALYGHAGEGCVHTRNDFDLASAAGVATWRRYLEAAADLCAAYGGSLSGEHGDGQARGELLGRMFGEELVGAFRAFKRAFDPDGRMNPGKVVDPYPPDTNLRLGPSYRRRDLGPTYFRFPEDAGSLAAAAERCVGVGRCRRAAGGTMCPSYMATKEELHSTRGRARLLQELLRSGGAVRGGWRDPHVREALDLCLSCKACKAECPVGVDMATYKAEFLAHYYRWRPRPRSAYATGLVHWGARLASLAPGLANALGRGRAVRWLAGLTTERPLPRLAPRTFRAGFARRAPAPAGREVLLWVDTFTNHFSPHVAEAAVEVLEAAGFRARLPRRPLCCGRPLYDAGLLGLARRQLRRAAAALAPGLAAGLPVVVLEPSCLSVFRDELGNLLPGDGAAQRLGAAAVSLAELLTREGWSPPRRLTGRALVQGHCHQRAVVGMAPDLALLEATGLEAELLDAGCCGLAGPFGFEAGHYELSMRIGELALFPAVRRAGPGTLVLADGFSCAAQIAHGTGRAPLHLAEVLRLALRAG